MTRPEDFDAERRRIIRKISILTWGLVVAAILLAIGGGALLAFFLQGAGLPFLRTWVILSLLLLAVPAAVHLAPRRRKDGEDG
jgi:uncharacterized membrane protein